MSEGASKVKEKGEKRKRPKGAQDPNHCDVDCTNSELKLWLVKVPKYLGQKWLDSPSADVGKLGIRRVGARTEVTFKLNQQLAQSGDPSPVDHKLMLSAPPRHETLGVLSRMKDDTDKEIRRIEGRIVQNATCTPSRMDLTYRSLKGRSFQKAAKSDRKVKYVAETEVSRTRFMPKSKHDDMHRPVRGQPERRERMDRDKLKELLFEQFEKHQYYSLKDLQDITKQPVQFLKEVLKEIAVYNSKQSSRNMWELKPENRYYDADSKKEE